MASHLSLSKTSPTCSPYHLLIPNMNKLKIRKVNEVQDVALEIPDTKTGKDLKNAYLEKIGKKGEKIRLFCIGQEIASHKQIYVYGICNDYVLICCVVK